MCLGCQLVAEAAGAKPRRASAPEIGWHEVELTPEAAGDPLLGGLPARFSAFQWHSYEAPLPPGATALARSPVCLQAFRLGGPAWGIQFHAEVSMEDVDYWISDYRSDPDAVRIGLDPEALRAETQAAIGAWNDLGRAMCERLASTLFGREVGAGEPAVHEERGRGHVRGLVGGQEQRGLCDLPGLGEAAHRQVHEAAAAFSGSFANSSWSSGVLTGPGHSALTRTPRRANSTPSSRESASTPPLEAV